MTTVRLVDVRPNWEDLPEYVRAAVGDVLGSPVVTAASQSGGFSPGTADRVVTADGTRAFVKVTGSAFNDRSTDFHRQEAKVVGSLSSPTIPALIGVADLGNWVAIVSEEIDGLPPELPWRDEAIAAVLDACLAIAAFPAAHLDDLQSSVGSMSALWDEIVEVPPDLSWAATRVRPLRNLAASVDVRGGALVHGDLRADNVLLRPDGSAVIVDWPWANRGAAWFDPVTLLFNVRLYDEGADVEQWLRHPAFDGVTHEGIDALLAAAAGFFLANSQRPPERGVERVRQFQLDQARVVLHWLEERSAVA
jgi:serine/threonine protein kinase